MKAKNNVTTFLGRVKTGSYTVLSETKNMFNNMLVAHLLLQQSSSSKQHLNNEEHLNTISQLASRAYVPTDENLAMLARWR